MFDCGCGFQAASKAGLTIHRKKCQENLSSSKWFCKLCSENFSNRVSLKNHNKTKNHKPVDFQGNSNDSLKRKCGFCRKTRDTTKSGISLHEKHCKKNPNRVPTRKVVHTPESRQKLSEAMKERHRKNLAAKWENPRIKRSWPEIFFSQVIENEFEDKNVDPEHPVGKYWIDFAWPHLMKAIEIDGQQHERYRHQIESDKKKDKYLSDQGWDLLRIKWSDMYENPKYWISVAKQFIDHRGVAQ